MVLYIVLCVYIYTFKLQIWQYYIKLIEYNTISPCSHETFKLIWNRFQSVWPSCERKQKVSNLFQTDLAQTYLRVGLKLVWNRFEDINSHVNALAT